ncbi:MAG: HD-GYP domain-containing protein [Acidobacteria bacterium]|nr:HD-GYP domain-containing protein [Acidobacteriota bacterium]
MSSRSNTYVAAIAIAAVAVLAGSAWTWHCADPVRYFCYLSIALAASALRLSIPGITGSVTVNYLFVLIGVVELSFGECVVMACLSALSECAWRHGKVNAGYQTLFNASVLTVSGAAAWGAYHLRISPLDAAAFPLQLGLASLVFFVVNTLAAAKLYAVEKEIGFWSAWKQRHVSSLLHYSVAGCAVALIAWLNRAFGWEVALLILPVVLERMESERKHSGDMSALHLRTVQTLALAIEAKDENTAGHLERVRVYAVEVGRQAGLSRQDLNALEAAAILHDIGKLAVPEHIISKPGRLTNEEFDRMKMHPVIGAQILAQVGFPYPVVPIVRSHHERWDGTGYPDGLAGEKIPLGARILAAVDCLDALASERQYRRALPLDEAMDMVEKESGKSFDPAVVAVLKGRYRELEKMARLASEQ